MTKFAVTLRDGSKAVVSADAYRVDEQGSLVFVPGGSGTFREWVGVQPLEPVAWVRKARAAVPDQTVEIVGLGPCTVCGRNPALGFASIYSDGIERWYCHPDDGPSCYAKAAP